MPIMVRIVHRDTFLSWCLIYLRLTNQRSVHQEQVKVNIFSVLAFVHENQDYVVLAKQLRSRL